MLYRYIPVEESPGREEHRTVESTGRRKFTREVTENNRLSYIHVTGKGENVG